MNKVDPIRCPECGRTFEYYRDYLGHLLADGICPATDILIRDRLAKLEAVKEAAAKALGVEG